MKAKIKLLFSQKINSYFYGMILKKFFQSSYSVITHILRFKQSKVKSSKIVWVYWLIIVFSRLEVSNLLLSNIHIHIIVEFAQ